MSSVKLFKKEINNTIGGFIEDVYSWELNRPDADLKSTEKLVDKAIALFDDLIQKVREAKKEGGKKGFKKLNENLEKAVADLNQELAKLG